MTKIFGDKVADTTTIVDVEGTEVHIDTTKQEELLTKNSLLLKKIETHLVTITDEEIEEVE